MFTLANKSTIGSFISFSLVLLAGYLVVMPAQAQIIIVKQDGTGDYTIIQDAVNASQDGDTVLVYPGTYYENINITGKGIVLAGTWIISRHDSLVCQTVIDGNLSGSCIRSLSGNLWSEIVGFTLTHGNGTNTIMPIQFGSGGGIFLKESKVIVRKCKITENFGNHGGGIFSMRSSLKFYDNTITDNWATGGGGGMLTSGSVVTFDSTLLNNIYLNYASYASDLAVYFNDTITMIYLDTCTVLNPDQYYIGKFTDWAIHMERPPISVLHGKIEQVNQDLFVSSYGNDTNSGLTLDDPLKTISFALLKIASDSLDMKTVHVANGLYSNILTGEHTPLQLKNWVSLKGESRENTIIDCQKMYKGARFAFGQDYTFLKNFTFLDGNGYPVMSDGGVLAGYSEKLVFDSIMFLGTIGDNEAAIYSDSDDSLIVKNSVFRNCNAHYAVSCGVKSYESPRYNEFISCEFSENHCDTTSSPDWEGWHATIGLFGSYLDYGWNRTLIMNCLLNDNINTFVSSGSIVPAAISTYDGCHVDIINSTIANNLTVNIPLGGAIGASFNSRVNIYNSILYGNYGYQAYLLNNAADEPDTMMVNHSLIQDSIAGIKNYGAYNQFFWGEGNLGGNPLFLDSEDYPYAIDFGSPCIDAGTLDLPPGIELPEFDLAGNPRVWGESVDMGAYEYGPWVGVREDRSQKTEVRRQMEVSPNPFKYGTYVSYKIQSFGKLNISVYSISGMKVRTLENHPASKGDSGKFYWNGTDEQGNKLPAGVYLIRMTMDGKEVETVKVVKG